MLNLRKTILIVLFLLSAVTIFAQGNNGSNPVPEPYRPLIHFSPTQDWMSDPNGLVYYKGEYHLFYQHLVKSGLPGSHWGHAVSSNLLHWQHLPIALAPDSLGQIFSGSCVVDINNTSRLGTKQNPPMLAIFTYHNPKAEKFQETQALAYSTDKGRSWRKYAANPIIKNPGLPDFRDPKVMWDETSKHWLMALAAGQVIKFYSSSDCLNWTFMSEFGTGKGNHAGPWECPDFFPIKVKGTNETKWVLLVSVVNLSNGADRLATATQYFIGDFDGEKFSSNQKDTLWVDHGKDCYAGNTFNNEPGGRRIFIAWMQSHQYAGQVQNSITKTWSGAATFPRELHVVKNDNRYYLESEPIKELSDLLEKKVKVEREKIDSNLDLSKYMKFEKLAFEVNLDFSTNHLPGKYGIRLKNDLNENITIYYDRKLGEIFVDRTNATGIKFNERYASLQQAPYKNIGKTMSWRLLIDIASLEFFTNDGKIVFTDTFYPTKPFDKMEVFSEEGTVILNEGTIQHLGQIY
ncbi:MAG: glycoside hydrolase family 32 protein [Mucilaginibacter sp.]|jgi:fructan beta-fructosidase|uniref:glycoside hydrolase family 32 protein n=1 Tax=Mucilaginibacter sp. TaxID=1882438 RepID=UPI003567A559